MKDRETSERQKEGTQENERRKETEKEREREWETREWQTEMRE